MKSSGKQLFLFLTALAVAFSMPVLGQGKQAKKKEDSAAVRSSDDSSGKSAPGSEDASYIIGPEDVLNISVWKEPEISRTVPVRPDGKISLPLLNDVQASGLRPTELAKDITEKLRKFLAEPQVTVIVTQINSRRIYILGEVNRSGAFTLLPNMTVLQALSGAGGFSQFADLKGIYVLRTEDGKQVKIQFNYKDVIRGQRVEQNIVLKPGDTIVVP